MDYAIIMRPLLGAFIGYVTNWIAVKMMFRPLKLIKIGKWKLPFTPGIIPKNKGRIANSIGNVISENLLTEQVLAENLLSENIERIISEKVIHVINNMKENNETLETTMNQLIERDSYEIAIAYIIDAISESIYETVKEANLGEIMAKQIESVAMEKVNGSILGMLGASSIVSKLSDSAGEKVNEYIRDNGKELISNMVEEEIHKITNTKFSEVIIKIEKSEIDIGAIVMKLYKKIVLEKLSDALKTINIAKIVSDKINTMDMLELEKMILEVMKKELNALVNLGAVIGFVLGLFNLLI